MNAAPETATLPVVAQIVELVTGTPAQHVQREQRFVSDLRIDSISMVEILAGLGARLGVRIEDEAVIDFRSVGDLVDYLDRRRRAGTPRS